MAIFNEGFKYALEAIKGGPDEREVRLVGTDTALPQGDSYTSSDKKIVFNSPAFVETNLWRMVSDATPQVPLTWEILPNSGETITITGIEIIDISGTPTVILQKDFEDDGSPVTYPFTSRAVFNLEQVIIQAGITNRIPGGGF